LPATRAANAAKAARTPRVHLFRVESRQKQLEAKFNDDINTGDNEQQVSPSEFPSNGAAKKSKM